MAKKQGKVICKELSDGFYAYREVEPGNYKKIGRRFDTCEQCKAAFNTSICWKKNSPNPPPAANPDLIA